jgi:hypothetical protein
VSVAARDLGDGLEAEHSTMTPADRSMPPAVVSFISDLRQR